MAAWPGGSVGQGPVSRGSLGRVLATWGLATHRLTAQRFGPPLARGEAHLLAGVGGRRPAGRRPASRGTQWSAPWNWLAVGR